MARLHRRLEPTSHAKPGLRASSPGDAAEAARPVPAARGRRLGNARERQRGQHRRTRTRPRTRPGTRACRRPTPGSDALASRPASGAAANATIPIAALRPAKYRPRARAGTRSATMDVAGGVPVLPMNTVTDRSARISVKRGRGPRGERAGRTPSRGWRAGRRPRWSRGRTACGSAGARPRRRPAGTPTTPNRFDRPTRAPMRSGCAEGEREQGHEVVVEAARGLAEQRVDEQPPQAREPARGEGTRRCGPSQAANGRARAMGAFRI